MQTSRPPSVHCPDCGTRYRWRPDFAGRELRCRCGCAFTPDPPEGVEVEAAAPKLPHVPATPFGAPKSAVERALEEGAFEAKAPLFTDRVLPVILLCLGLPASVALAWAVTPSPRMFAVAAVGLIVFELVAGMPMLLGALAWLAATFGEGLGRLGEVMLKLASLSLGAGLVADVLFGFMMGNLHDLNRDFNSHLLYVGGIGGGFTIYFLIQGLPAWAMFRWHPAMIAGAVGATYLVRFGLFFAVFYVLEPYWK